MLAMHLISGAYGFWLPNDPRGSWSEFVGSWNLYRYGPATKTNETTSVAYRPHDHEQRKAAKKALIRPPVIFTGVQARAVVRGFKEYSHRSELKIYACAVLPDHFHLVVAVPKLPPRQLLIQLKAAATRRLIEEDVHPFRELPKDVKGRLPKCFARGGWSVFLDTAHEVRRAITYVDDNPQKENKKRQHWPFIVPFTG